MYSQYQLNDTGNLNTPCLIYYTDIIRENIQTIIRIAGDPERLWPHIKTHKSLDLIKLQIQYGIRKFKAATISEAEIAAAAGAEKVLLAYPLIGPARKRFLDLAEAYPSTVFYAVGDDLEQLGELSELCLQFNRRMAVLADVDMGMNRTGVPISQLEAFCRMASQLEGISFEGLHCYDGSHEQNFEKRDAEIASLDLEINQVISHLLQAGVNCSTVVAGGSPSFPCHARHTDWYLSPGTLIVQDAGYCQSFPDIPCTPGAAVLSRVVSHPDSDLFTIDLGYKGIAADPPGQRGYIAGLEDAEPVMQSEEHWVFRMKNGKNRPPIGTCLYVIPTHICPTTALYPEILTAENGSVTGSWNVTARNRKITY